MKKGKEDEKTRPVVVMDVWGSEVVRVRLLESGGAGLVAARRRRCSMGNGDGMCACRGFVHD